MHLCQFVNAIATDWAGCLTHGVRLNLCGSLMTLCQEGADILVDPAQAQVKSSLL